MEHFATVGDQNITIYDMKIGVKINQNCQNPSGKVLVLIVLLFCLGHKANFHMVLCPVLTFQPITLFRPTVQVEGCVQITAQWESPPLAGGIV